MCVRVEYAEGIHVSRKNLNIFTASDILETVGTIFKVSEINKKIRRKENGKG